ncbi:MAG: anaerobic ribonucleoside-triphosphate reductase activating protein [Bacteroidales bacterium]
MSLKYTDYDIVFQEVPNEVSLAVNLSRCPHRCPGCHSAQLQQDIGELLTEDVMAELLKKYGSAITCVCFMGGDADLPQLESLARHIRTTTALKTAWYSGNDEIPLSAVDVFNYIKIGPYIARLGNLRSATTNQRMYRILPNGRREPIALGCLAQ